MKARSLGALFVFMSLPLWAQDYPAGHQALEVWNADALETLPTWIKVWLMFMASVFVSGIVFVKNHREARWVVGGFVAGLLFSKFGIPALGLLPLSGLVALTHLVFWTPALILLIINRPFMKAEKLSAYAVWSGLAIFTISFSFIFDIRDATIYLTQSGFAMG